MGAVELDIISFDDAYAKDFASLNYEWIERYFTIEPHDREMLDDPEKYIIGRGGQIFFAIIGGRAVGTAALINENDRFELAKMAVSPAFQGGGLGDRLMDACIDHARSAGKKRIFLLSNTKLTPAIKLYRKHGFVETPLAEPSPYERVNIRMELAL